MINGDYENASESNILKDLKIIKKKTNKEFVRNLCNANKEQFAGQLFQPMDLKTDEILPKNIDL